MARVDTVLRRAGVSRASRASRSTPDRFSAGALVLEAGRGEISAGGEPRARLVPFKFTGTINKVTFNLEPEQLTAEERKQLPVIADAVARAKDQVLPADSLIDHVWGPNSADRAMLKQLIYRLRAKIEQVAAGAVRIETLPGVGYSLVTSPEPPE